MRFRAVDSFQGMANLTLTQSLDQFDRVTHVLSVFTYRYVELILQLASPSRTITAIPVKATADYQYFSTSTV